MGLLQITRDLKTKDKSMVPRNQFAIGIDEYLNEIKDYTFHNQIGTYEMEAEKGTYVLSDYISNGRRLFSLTHSDGQVSISYDGRLSDEIVVVCHIIAERLHAYLLAEVGVEYPKHKVVAAQARFGKKQGQVTVQYQSKSFGGNSMWLAIRSNTQKVKEYFHLQGERKTWNEALTAMYSCNGIFMYEFRGWTFLAGQEIDVLFILPAKNEEAIEQHYVNKLLSMGKIFPDVQLFMHYDRSTYLNAFYRVLGGELLYGEYYTESYNANHGLKHVEASFTSFRNATS